MSKKNRIHWKSLRGFLWGELARREGPLDSTALNCGPDLSYSNSNRSAKWASRGSVPQASSALKHKSVAPLSYLLFCKAPFELLSNSKLSAARIGQIMSLDSKSQKLLKTELHGESILLDPGTAKGWRIPGSSVELVQRGDLLAFFTLLAKVRIAEWENDFPAHIEEIGHLYRCLAGLGRFEWLRRDFGLLCDLVELVHRRISYTEILVGVDWDIIVTQFNDPSFEPDPEKRDKDPDTRQPLAIADPVRLAKAVSLGVRPSSSDGSEPIRNSTPFDGGYFKNLTYAQICRMHTDQLLLMSFMQTAHLWGVLRSDWEAVLGVSSSRLKGWMELGVSQLSKVARQRILTINVIREWMHQDSGYREQWASIVQESRDDLRGRSIHQLLCSGGAMALLEMIPTDTADEGEKQTLSAFLPLASFTR